MNSLILVSPCYDAVWPFAADHARRLWEAQGPVEFVRIGAKETRAASELSAAPEKITRALFLGVRVSRACVDRFSALREFHVHGSLDFLVNEAAVMKGWRQIQHTAGGFWGQSVAEFALGLTLCALRRIPQTHRQILTDLSPWQYEPADMAGTPGGRGQQFGDDPRFTHGTIAGKRVRIVGAGNIASRYASWTSMMGADVAAWDPLANEPSFHRSGARREWFLERLVRDAEIFAPMVPFSPATRQIVSAALIDALPKGCLVVLVTRAGICDMQALRRRVLANELSLAADVFDVEPLPLDDPLLGRDNVVHTPHNAGRTVHANEANVQELVDKFSPLP